MKKIGRSFAIRKLTQDYLDECIAFANKLFPYHRSKTRGPESSYRTHLRDPNYAGYAHVRNIKQSEYFVLIDRATKSIVGVIGYFCKYGVREQDAAWIDWFGISADYQSQGLGSRLFRFIIHKLAKQGVRCIKLLTSSRKAEARAQQFYESFGFLVTRTYHKRDKPYQLFLRKKFIHKKAASKGGFYLGDTIFITGIL